METLLTKLAGWVAIVTGGGRGICRGIALELARQGADVVVSGLNLANAQAVADEVHALGRRVRQALDAGHGGVIAQCEWGKYDPTENIEAVLEAWLACGAIVPNDLLRDERSMRSG